MKREKNASIDDMLEKIKEFEDMLENDDIVIDPFLKEIDKILSDIRKLFNESGTAPTGLDWRSPDVWPRKEEADSRGYVLAFNKDDGYISSWRAASIVSCPDNFCCWAPMPKMPDDLMRPQRAKMDGGENDG